MSVLKIATWNISCGIPFKWNMEDGVDNKNDYKNYTLIDEVIEKINSENIDIIGIQESVSFENGEKSYAEIIAENTNLKYYTTFKVSKCHLIENASIEEVVLSRFPIKTSKNIMFENANLSKTSKDGRIYKLFDFGFIISNIKINDNLTLSFVTGHAPSFQVFDRIPEDYVGIYKKLEDNVEDIIKENKNVFVVGDYNSEKLLEMLPVLNDNFKNYVQGATFEGTSVDYILAKKNIKCLDTYMLQNQSDHTLCIASFEI